MSDLIIGMCVPRTGSSALQRILKKIYRGHWSGAVGCTPEEAWNNFSINVGKRRHSLSSISGHFPYGIHAFFPDYTPKYVTLSRSPVDRVVSLWKFSYRFHKLTLSDWLASPLSEFAHEQMTRYTMGGPVNFPCIDEARYKFVTNPKRPVIGNSELSLVKERLSNFLLIGTFDRFPNFQDSLVKLTKGKISGLNEWLLTPKFDDDNPTKIYTPSQREVNTITSLNTFDILLHDWIGTVAP